MILIVSPGVSFIFSNVRNAVNNTLEQQPRRSENVLITTRAV